MPVLCQTSYHISLTLQNRMTGFKLWIGNDSWAVGSAELWLSTLGDQVLVGINQNCTKGHADNLVLWRLTYQKMRMCHDPAQFTTKNNTLLSSQKAFSLLQ